MEFLAQHSANAELAAFCQPELLSVAAMLGLPLSLRPRPLPAAASTAADAPHDDAGSHRLRASSTYFSFGTLVAPSTPASAAAAPISPCIHSTAQRQLLQVARRTVLVEELFVPLVVSPSLPDAIAAFSRLAPFDPTGFRPVRDLPPPGREGEAQPCEVVTLPDATNDGLTFAVRVESYEHKYTPSEKLAILQQFPFDRFHPTGHVQLLQARDRFVIFLEHERIPTPAGTTPGPSTGTLRRVMVCHAVTGPSERRALLERYSLKHRPYIGTTSMPPELTFLMCNLAHVQRGHLVMDPFCGTGSNLVTAGHWGAMTLGTDMDGRVMRSGTAKVLSVQQQQQVQLAMHRYTATSTQPPASATLEQPAPRIIESVAGPALTRRWTRTSKCTARNCRATRCDSTSRHGPTRGGLAWQCGVSSSSSSPVLLLRFRPAKGPSRSRAS
jgi:hypothetical protein